MALLPFTAAIMSNLTTEEWLRIIGGAADEVATVALGFEKCDVKVRSTAIGSQHVGAYLPLGTLEHPMQIALLAEPSGCQALAKALLGMDAGDEDLGDADLSDAVSELLNVLAGGVKRRAQGRVEIQMGLPLFVKGVIQGNEHLAIMAADVLIGSTPAVVLLVTPRRAESKRGSAPKLKVV